MYALFLVVSLPKANDQDATMMRRLTQAFNLIKNKTITPHLQLDSPSSDDIVNAESFLVTSQVMICSWECKERLNDLNKKGAQTTNEVKNLQRTTE
jgi:hypothetical protein